MISRTFSLFFIAIGFFSVLFGSFIPVVSYGNEDEEALYLIRSIETKSNHSNPVTAKRNAFTKAQKSAFQQLLLKITPSSASQSIPLPDKKTTDTLIRDITFLEEKIGTSFYYAKLDIRFQPERVKTYLARFGIAPSTNTLTSVLVIPLYQEAGITRLWERNNLWLNAWEDHNNLTTSGIKILTPRASLQDMNQLNHRDVIQLNEKRMERLAKQYNTEHFIVSFAKMVPDINGNTIKLAFQTLSFIRGTSGSTINFTDNVPSISEITPSMQKATERIIQDIALSVAKRKINAKLARSNKGSQQTYLVSVPLNSLQHLIDVQKKLENIPEFRDLTPRRINKKQALFSLVTDYQPSHIIAILKAYAIVATSDLHNPKFITLLPQ